MKFKNHNPLVSKKTKYKNVYIYKHYFKNINKHTTKV